MKSSPEISIILPCLNEEKAIPKVLAQIKQVIQDNNLNAEIIVIDNGSKDNSLRILKKIKGIKLFQEKTTGYGSAYLRGFKEAKGKYIFMADSDGSYDFSEIPRFIHYLRQGYDFVIGNRFQRKMQKNAMTWSHKYLGNPILSTILRIFFRTNVKDSHCGMRAITKQALTKLKLQTIGMEFASEMIIKSIKNRLKIKQLPINYYKRIGKSKLKTASDGWRHLRFMLLYSPVYLFIVPGLIFFLTGIYLLILLTITTPEIFGIKFYFHPMFLASLLTILGYQIIFFGIFAKTYAINYLGEQPTFERFYKQITIEKASIFGILLILLGSMIFLLILKKWISTNFGELYEIKKSILSLTLITLGIQTIFSSFMLSILGIKEK